MRTNPWLNRLLILVLIFLSIGPIAWDYIYPGAYARWLLAYAANEYDRGNTEKAHRLLSRAYDLAPDISSDRNFWEQLSRIELSPDTTFDGSIWMQLIRRIPNTDERANAAAVVASMMLERRMYPQAVSLMQEYFPRMKERSSLQNNLIAYARALAGQDLEEALTEVNLAIADQANESFLDTRAWILHRMGSHDEALVEIDRSMKMLMERLSANSPFGALLESMEKIQRDHESLEPTSDSPAEGDSRPSQQKETGWAYSQLQEKYPWLTRASEEYMTLAILHYHRFKILEALELKERAEEDRRWLEAFSPKPWDSLE